VAVRGQSYLYSQGDTAKFTVEARDYDDKPVQTSVRVELVRNSWNNGRSKSDVLQTQNAQTGADGTATVDIPLKEAGDFAVIVKAQTSENREVSGSTYVWVPGSGENWWGGSERQIKIIPDKKSYKVGEIAKLLLVTGVPESYILLTTEGLTLQTKRIVHATSSSVTVEVPITADNQPN